GRRATKPIRRCCCSARRSSSRRTTRESSPTDGPHACAAPSRCGARVDVRNRRRRVAMMQPRLEMSGISKRYGGVRAIRDAQLTVPPGSVHALVGENGAGKSTLIKILAGAEQADTGTIRIDGAPVHIDSTGDAIALGVQTVYQEPHLFQDLSVAEN